MNAKKYPRINVMNIVRGFNRDGLKYRVNPVRFQKKDGEVVKISKVRHFHHERKGKGRHYHYVVEDKEDGYYHICLDTNSYTWRLIQEKVGGVERSMKTSKK